MTPADWQGTAREAAARALSSARNRAADLGRSRAAAARQDSPPAATPGSPPATPPSAGQRLLVLVGAARADAVHAFPDLCADGWQTAAVGALRPGGGRTVRAEVAIVAGSVAELRRVVPWLVRAGRSAQVTVAVLATDRPDALSVPAAGLGARVLTAWESRTPGPGPVAVAVRLGFAKALGVPGVVHAVLGGRRVSGRVAPAAGLRLALSSSDALAWAAGDPGAELVSAATTFGEAATGARFDVLVGPEVRPDPERGGPRVDLAEGLRLPPVDWAVVSPAGFSRDAGPAAGSLELTAPTAGAASLTAFRVLAADGAVLAAGDARAGLTENHIASLRALRGVDLAAEPGAPPWAVGRVLAQLCCAGVPTRAADLPGPVADALGPDLAGHLRALDLEDLADPLAREAFSVATRRLALLRFGPGPFWSALGAAFGLAAAPTTVSAVLATRRPEFLPFALAQLARQDWPAVQTVLVLHGFPAGEPGVARALAAYPRPLVVVEVDAGVVFGAALNEGLARCSGRLVTKIDDDDWYGPHHLTDLVLAHAYSGATMVGLARYYVYLQGSDVTLRLGGAPTEAPATWLAGPTMLMGADEMAELGGWRPTRRGVDANLLRTVRAAGGTLYSGHDLGFTLYRGHDHTYSAPAGDRTWLQREGRQFPGFSPPPHLDALPHPGVDVPGSPRDPTG